MPSRRGVTSDGSTIVFVIVVAPEPDLWKADANGRRMTRLAPSVTMSRMVITPDDRSVIYRVPHRAVGGDLDGRDRRRHAGEAHRRRQRVGRPGTARPWPSPTVGRRSSSARFPGAPRGEQLVPRNSTRLCHGSQTGAALPTQVTGTYGCRRWTAARRVSSRGSPTGGRFGDFQWSRDGKRLALTRSTETNDIVLLKGLK